MTSRSGRRAAPGADWGEATERGRIPWIDLLILIAAGLVVFRFLARIWSADPNYAFGWGVPLLAGYLLFERWPQRPFAHSPERTKGLPLVLLFWGAAYLVGRLLLEVVPDWRPALWVVASLYVATLIAWCWLYGGRAWSRHFFFPIAFLLCSVPWLYNLESPVIQGLTRWNATLVADSLLLADIPVRAAGNTLLLSTGQLGIEEACSGLRSLQAAVMMGLFLGAFYRFSTRTRGWILLLAISLALVGNYLRLLLLAAKGARDGISAVAALHDSAGAGILIFTVLGLWMACLILSKRGAVVPATKLAGAVRPAVQPNRTATGWAAAILLITLGSEAATKVWFTWRESSAPRPAVWTVQWPVNFPGYRALPIFATTHELLGDVSSKSGTWSDASGWRWNALWFKYSTRAPNRLSADVHNPEICLRGAGFHEVARFPPSILGSGSVNLPAQAYLFSSDAAQEYVFWISSLDRLAADESHFERGRIIYGPTSSDFLRRLLLWGNDIRSGVREIDAQTLEVSIAGPPDYASARRAFAGFADRAIMFSPSRSRSPAR